ncbi:hypothetical protein PHLGIDRAFT_170895 [Phlebiopsis gigantea 11061_1 CR5-6]|uniref:Uncharacterized protein n=1 Tax=Phlebiopsis gigantea (strain 11061_1 CR5-6) TaxID=745531 RepID=A0A0C3S4E9_PHLG1|nr:hypothetical protein PHLGIDRAFT_170895 [Phlebiopsis gigantea 11061_1 CR5-6]
MIVEPLSFPFLTAMTHPSVSLEYYPTSFPALRDPRTARIPIYTKAVHHTSHAIVPHDPVPSLHWTKDVFTDLFLTRLTVGMLRLNKGRLSQACTRGASPHDDSTRS